MPISHGEQVQDYCTPPWVVQDVVGALGPIALDPCATRAGLHSTVPAQTRLTIDDELGYFSADWTLLAAGGLIYVNPEYGGGDLSSRRWMEPVARWAAAGESIACLLRVSTGSEWWHDLVVPYVLQACFYRGRIKFWDPRTGEETHGNMHDSVMLLMGSFPPWRTQAFQHVFSKRGWIV